MKEFLEIEEQLKLFDNTPDGESVANMQYALGGMKEIQPPHPLRGKNYRLPFMIMLNNWVAMMTTEIKRVMYNRETIAVVITRDAQSRNIVVLGSKYSSIYEDKDNELFEELARTKTIVQTIGGFSNEYSELLKQLFLCTLAKHPGYDEELYLVIKEHLQTALDVGDIIITACESAIIMQFEV